MQHRIRLSRSHLALVTFLVLALSLPVFAQDPPKRGRKYVPPPPVSKITVTVVRHTTGKPVENAAVIFHTIEDGKDTGNMEMKTNQDGEAKIDVIPIGDTLRLQIIANGFQTFGEDYKIDAETKEIVVKLKRPSRQFSIYEHPAGDTPTPAPTDQPSPQQNQPKPQQGTSQPPPK